MRPRLLPALLLALAPACTGFHEVAPGIYRDRQPAEDELVRAIERHDIRTVIVLRGAGEGAAPSRRAALATDVRCVHVPISATRLPPPDRLLRLWDAIAHAERPILFHCRAGVDRTGLAAALAVLHDTGDLDRARGQLALIPFGHVGIWGTEAMDEVLDRYEPWHGRLPFPAWVEQVYARQLAGEDVPPPSGG